MTVYGRYWNCDASGAPWYGGFGSDLRSVARYANGPCAYAPSGSACKLDTRNLVIFPGWGLYESISAYGRYWLFDEAGTLVETHDARQVWLYANGPCRYAPPGSACTFDSREFANIPGRGMIEVITAYGRY